MKKKTRTSPPVAPRRKLKKNTAIRLADHIVGELDEFAAKRGQNRSALIQQAIAEWLERERKKE